MAIGFGIVGCGMIAATHAQAIREIRGARLIGCTSRRAESAESFATQQGIEAFPSVTALANDPRIDIVTICTPSGAHLEPALEVARAGKHLAIEKPLEVTLPRCDRIIQACAAAGVKLATIFPSRFHGCWRELKRALDAGRFGTLSLADAYIKWYRTQAYYDSGQWRGTWELDGGGALMNQGIHTIDLLQWLVGPVQSIGAMTATLAHERIEVEDSAVACLRFANGGLGSIEATTASYPGALKRIEIHGSQGSAIVEEESILQWSFAKPRAQDDKILAQFGKESRSGGGASDPAAIGHWGHRELLQDLAKAVRTDGQPAIDGAEGRKSVEIILGIYAAAKSGRTVNLPLPARSRRQ